MKLTYTPPPSIAGFLLDESFIALAVGPVGSTKTTCGIMKIAYHAKRMAPCTDGIRRSRCIWVRNTREQLRDTSIPDFLKWFPDGQAGVYEKTNSRFILKFDDVECEVLFRGLDDANDVRRLLSLQASFAVLDEFREINQAIFEAIQTRLGRYPDKMLVPPRPEWGVDDDGHPIGGCVTDDGKSNKHLWGMTNPPDMDTFWERFLSDPPVTAKCFFQPSGMSPEADWTQYLPASYYPDISQGKSEDWVDVYVHAKFGKSLAGRPVHREFNADVHVAKETLNFIRGEAWPIVIGHDFGLTPSVVIGQPGPQGRLLILADIVSEGMGAIQFVRQKLKPLLTQRFAGVPHFIIGDPAGQQRAQTDERSVFDILRAEGFNVRAARTNNISPRIAAVDNFLMNSVDGRPRMLIDPSAVNVIRALRGGYRFKAKKDGEYDPQPEKNSHSHVADALQYLCLHADGGRTFGEAGFRAVAKKIIARPSLAHT